ncbi:undecaprenyl/decaprenyl-phosphate alpha-N-acetylglucosaminyl 1-phosphate transferase, partial [Fulvivirga sp. RKSG066]|uniref:MraY family glycosyltransferase n=1 Tax=Fulvivirga aurantia TaxID=2529383 RepID=UPI0012BB854B
GRRKIHKKRTPSLGGIGIFLGFFAALLIWMPFDDVQSYKYILASISIIFFIGMRDDIVALRPLYKLIGQIVAAIIVVKLAGVQLHSLYGLFGIESLPNWAGMTLSIFTIIVITNSFNLIDGLDGLAGTIATIVLVSFGTWFFLIEEPLISLLAFSMAGAVVAFLSFNWEPSKIFMGDTGALVIGFLFSVLAIYFIDHNYSLPDNSVYKFESSVTTAVCVIIIPLFDTLRIFILRLWKKQSPFTPDKNHMHHALMRLGMGHSKTALALGALNVFYILVAIQFRELEDNLMLPIILVLSTGLSLLLDYLIIRRLKRG